MVRRSAPASSRWVAKQWRRVCGWICLLWRPARSAAIWQALHRTFVVTGWLDVCRRLPGKSHSFGLRRSPAAGTVLSGGTQTLSVTFIPTNTTDYATATASVTLLVNPAAQTVTFPVLSSPVSPITLSATASSGLAVTFSATGPATVSGNLLTITGAGAVVVAASQPVNANYSASNTVSRNLNVTKATQTISFSASSPVTYGVSPITLSA